MSLVRTYNRSVFAKVGLLTLAFLIFLLVSLFLYLAYREVKTNNDTIRITANLTAQSVADKVDRNFYERFGDVQAFAVNHLAVQACVTDSVAPEAQKFINTMVQYYVLYDLMMLCDRDGRVLLVNTVDKKGDPINSSFVLNENVVNQPWFVHCTTGNGPEGGAWYSDFMVSQEVSRVYGSSGGGMAFAAPVRNDQQEIVGVWYNFASWREVTEGIRQEAEKNLTREHAGAFLVLTREDGEVISADNPKMLGYKVKIAPDSTVQAQGTDIQVEQYVTGVAFSKGAYTYQGKRWRVVTFIPAEGISWGVLVSARNLGVAVVSLVLLVLVSYLVVNHFRRNVVARLAHIGSVQHKLSLGEVEHITDDGREDEIGQMVSSLAVLSQNIEDKTEFANEIARGNLEVELRNIQEGDKLGNALQNMRNQLRLSIESSQQRNWVTQGLAEIGNILRSHSDSETLYVNIIRFVVKYTNSNQGSLFLLNDDEDHQETHLRLVACYAWDKRKFLEKKITPGEGLIGQAMLEKQTMYLTDVPRDYVHITSGLGEANPGTVLIVPMLANEEVMGVLELASFQKFEPHEIEFIEKLGESVASSVSSLRVNERTKILLEQARQQTEEMRAQEEEMRQNMEELSATQEEIRRSAQETESRMQAIAQSGVLSAEFDLEGMLVTANETFLTLFDYALQDIVGRYHRSLLSEETARHEERLWEEVMDGHGHPGEYVWKNRKGGKIYLYGSYSLIRNADGTPKRVLILATDISDSKHQVVRLQEQEEEMKQNLEELKATQEQMESVLAESREREVYMQELMNASGDSIFTLDMNLKLLSWNERFGADLRRMGLELAPGFDMLTLFAQNPEKGETQRHYYERALKGESFSVQECFDIAGSESCFISYYHPLRHADGSVFALAVTAREVTELVKLRAELERLKSTS